MSVHRGPDWLVTVLDFIERQLDHAKTTKERWKIAGILIAVLWALMLPPAVIAIVFLKEIGPLPVAASVVGSVSAFAALKGVRTLISNRRRGGDSEDRR
ncbi:hypothetical protein DLJ60_08900 [Micromonospora chalcea]|uniref:Uncharacterized protein n=1 Tax=Micromonospora chalcea TaxID=1874 RepID=A0ABX9Y978_MICCH|nr:hypothetical protein DLJ60_08900 [Micromonospora chalcea]RQX29849.1 hypothetical protein DLJ57_21480 [Micromonospora chalcea]